MSADDILMVDGVSIRFVAVEPRTLRVLAGEEAIGSLDQLENRTGYSARGVDGKYLTRASPWGGPVTARFGSKELAVRALIERTRAG